MEPVKSAFLEAADRPLPEIFEQLRNLSLSFGKQEDDDQTVLLVRCLRKQPHSRAALEWGRKCILI